MSPNKPGAENNPLLSTTTPSDADDYDSSDAYAAEKHVLPRRITVVIPCLLLLVAMEIGGTLVGVPMNQIQEGILCRQRYPNVLDTSTDARCKSSNVQSALSSLQGWELTFSLIPGILTAVPYGIAADRYGRKAILGLSLLGIFLVQAVDIVVCSFPQIFPIRLVWLGAMCSLIGGGPFVPGSVVWTSKLTLTRWPSIFFYLSAVPMGCELISMPLAYVAMQRGPWFSVFVGLACMSTSVLIALICPETRSMAAPESDAEGVEQTLGCGRVALKDLRPRLLTLVEQVTTLFQSMFLQDRRLGILLSSLLFTTLGRYASTILMQYTTKRFGWSWSQAGIMSSVSTLVNLILVVAILPPLSHALRYYLELGPMIKDLWIARASIFALIAGSFGIGLSSTSPMLMGSLMVYGLGSGYGAAMRGLLSQVAGNKHVGALYTTMSVVENMGMLIAGPLLAATFRVGLGWGTAWTGLPFFAAGILLAFAGVIVSGVRLQGLEKNRNEEEEEEEEEEGEEVVVVEEERLGIRLA
ncbi:major facilitator superfamily protein [Hirsutella rhossiliensis]|uniref:Major facilitator superfamily domain-containing protein n=1 Tax=Hirsutella rhossiliensis TaxID=111463 RepID=A0A9P8SP54_9HYPO|nr:major facilitator superfamily domain-containing protein [Hirsutella rhossiliensis]KAH0967851.1 major facilitator superfamily domain-containing protein [Hirsutella rhossiliensis]